MRNMSFDSAYEEEIYGLNDESLASLILQLKQKPKMVAFDHKKLDFACAVMNQRQQQKVEERRGKFIKATL